MASGSNEFYTSTYILASLDWSESSISVSDNTSKVTVSLWYKRTNTYAGSTDDWGNPFWILIDGSWYNIGSGFSIPGHDNSWHKVGEASKTITHNSDGSKSITIGCEHSTSGSLFNCDESWTVALDTIPRASVPTVAPSTVLLSDAQNTITVNTNRKSNSFTHTLALTIGNHTETQTAVSTSTDFSIPKTVLADFASNSLTLEGSIVCTTYNGSTQIGSAQTVKFTAQIDTSQEHPAIGTITLTDTNSASAAIETSGTFIKNASNLRAVISLSAVGSYTQLASAVVQCGNTQQTYALSGTSQTVTFNYNKLDADSLIVTVYDKRGTSRASTRNWTLVPYRDLTVTGSVDRTSETGSTIAFTLNGDCFAGSFGNTTNQVTVDYEWKLSSESDFHTVTNAFIFTPLGGRGETQFTYSNTLTGFDYDKQYNLRFTVKDMFTSATTRVLTLTVGIPVWAYGEDWHGVYGKSYLHYDRDNPSKFWDINDALNGILDHAGIKNLLPNPEVKSTAVHGVTYSVGVDGTVTATGTATEYAVYTLCNFQTEAGREYILSGCPAGGGSFTYDLGIGNLGTDTGNGFKFTGDGTALAVTIAVFNGATVSGVVFSPMVRDARIASESYVQGGLPMIPHYYQYNQSLPAVVGGGGNRVNADFSVHGNGLVLMYASFMDNSNGNYGTMRVGFDYKHGSDAWFALGETLDRNISQGNGQYSARICSSAATMATNGDKIELFYSTSNDATTHTLRCQFVSFGCYVTQD